ncbi:glycosyltransferase family 2 protein [Donghicola sp. XS_ASV15]|uniref:glycosyltransferase family 2 protein n=1 Tax=Donghicola sp. XS_ASV15 TaxID=3241295 RepID=UPI003510DB33
MVFVFWAAVVFLAYVIFGYGLLLLGFSRLASARPATNSANSQRVDILIPAHNESACIAEKLRNTLDLNNPQDHLVRIIVIDDGSTDGTAEIVRRLALPQVELIETPGRLGKLAAMNLVVPQLSGDIVIFTDANAMLLPETLEALVAPFADPEVGGVCGQISVNAKTAGQIGRAESLFWRYDQAMKAAEARLGGVCSAQGSIYAMRRELVPDVPPGAADDFYISVAAVEAGYRLAFAPNALTEEVVTEKATKEMGRRVRSTEMGWRALMRYRALMNPLRTGWYGWQLLSHKGMRRMAPFALALVFLSNLFLIGQGWFYALTGLGQIAGYVLVALAWAIPALRKLPLVGAAMFFVMGNLAMFLGLVRYWRGRESSLWTPVREG